MSEGYIVKQKQSGLYYRRGRSDMALWELTRGKATVFRNYQTAQKVADSFSGRWTCYVCQADQQRYLAFAENLQNAVELSRARRLLKPCREFNDQI